MRIIRLVLPLLLAALIAPVRAQQPSSATTPTPQEVETYESFRAWITMQPPDVRGAADVVVYERYAAVLRKQGKSEADAIATITSLKAMGDRAEVERWNRILTAADPLFNTSPNAFLVAVTKGLKPGRSLDVGMGQGRNTIYLAQQGWESVGFDPAERAVAAARAQAAKLGVTITTRRGFRLGTGAMGPDRSELCGRPRVRRERCSGVAAGRDGRRGSISSRRHQRAFDWRSRRLRHERTAQAVRGITRCAVRGR
jgi:SAM-dependent methyltransferase